MGLRVPEDISIMGFDNIAISAFTDPPLTTIKQPKKKMGATAMQLLIDLVRHKRVEKKKILMPTEVVVRQSTGKVPTAVRIPMFRK
jgi:LacI family repressor for deo operon, udp, cdd, tsx, nupC, and nupG